MALMSSGQLAVSRGIYIYSCFPGRVLVILYGNYTSSRKLVYIFITKGRIQTTQGEKGRIIPSEQYLHLYIYQLENLLSTTL